MNVYKKIMTLVMALTIASHAFASMPNIEEIGRKQFEKAYEDIFTSPYNLFKPIKEFKQWNDNMAELIGVAKNNSGNDPVITETISKLLIINANFIGAMKAGYALFAANPYPSALEKSKIMIPFSNNKLKLDEATNKLRKETYLLPGKRKAKDILLFIFDKLSRAQVTAENALNK